MASNCRCDSPKVGDSAGTRRDTVDGWKHRVCCIPPLIRLNLCPADLDRVEGARWWSVHQVRKTRRSEAVWIRDWPRYRPRNPAVATAVR